MTSSSETHRHSGDSHPGGGTATNGGTRTPRRVQWAGNDNVRVDGNPDTSPRQSVHELDEMGLDVRSHLLITSLRCG